MKYLYLAARTGPRRGIGYYRSCFFIMGQRERRKSFLFGSGITLSPIRIRGVDALVSCYGFITVVDVIILGLGTLFLLFLLLFP